MKEGTIGFAAVFEGNVGPKVLILSIPDELQALGFMKVELVDGNLHTIFVKNGTEDN